MIEKQIVAQKVKELMIKEYIEEKMGKAGYSHTEIKKTPLGEKIIIFTSKPGLIVGRKGENIKELTEVLKSKFKLENPQIEVAEIENPYFDAFAVARRISNTMESFGPRNFKSLGYKLLDEIMRSGAAGAEILMSGRGIPSSRAKSWRFSAGFMKKSGDIAETKVKKGLAVAHLRSGAIGIKVHILTPDVILPDKLIFVKAEEKKVEIKPIIEAIKEEVKTEVPKKKKKEVKTEIKLVKEEVKPTKERKPKQPKKKVEEKPEVKEIKDDTNKEN